jgi:hypothetical protein
MSDDRDQFNVRLNAEVADRFRAFVQEAEGKTDGTLGEHVETALLEYMDRDRGSRIEDKIDQNRELIEQLHQTLSEGDGHTHTPESGFSGSQTQPQTPNTSGSPTVERTRKIAERVYDLTEVSAPTEQVERAIVDIAGGHDQTVQKYKKELRRRGLLFEHPSENADLWYVDRSEWAERVKNYARATPDAEGTADKVAEKYPLKFKNIDGSLRVVANE